MFAVHKVGDRYFFEIDNAMFGRDFLLVSRISGVPAGSGGFTSAGSAVAERMVRWERRDNNVLLRSISVDAYADPETPIAKSVIENNFAPILASFPNRRVRYRQHHRCRRRDRFKRRPARRRRPPRPLWSEPTGATSSIA